MSADVRMFTVGPVQENAYIVSAGRESGRAVVVDPGEESERLLAAAQALGVQVEAVLVTHCHFDHIGAVAPVARATGAPVYCPEIGAAAVERHHDVGARGVRPVRELGGRAHRQRRRAPHARGPGDRGGVHPRPQPGARDVRDHSRRRGPGRRATHRGEHLPGPRRRARGGGPGAALRRRALPGRASGGWTSRGASGRCWSARSPR